MAPKPSAVTCGPFLPSCRVGSLVGGGAILFWVGVLWMRVVWTGGVGRLLLSFWMFELDGVDLGAVGGACDGLVGSDERAVVGIYVHSSVEKMPWCAGKMLPETGYKATAPAEIAAVIPSSATSINHTLVTIARSLGWLEKGKRSEK